MRRREFITLLGSAAALWPLAARAQHPAKPLIGWLDIQTLENRRTTFEAFRKGLGETGFVDGQNATIDFRSAEYRSERLPGLASDFVRRPVDLIMAATNGPVLAAKAATKTIPIVFAGGFDPVEIGAVANLARPGGNVTGVSFFTNALEAKRLGLLHVVVPQAKVIGVLANPDNASYQATLRDLKEAARALGLELAFGNASRDRDLEPAFATFGQQGAGALQIAADTFFSSRSEHLLELAARHAIPTIYSGREFTTAGGLMGYSSRQTDAYHEAGVYAGRILRGAKPADLPVMLPTKFELVINLKTAKALGLTIPEGLLLAADEIIE
jgi:putative ABC transport system substrate-binding protein